MRSIAWLAILLLSGCGGSAPTAVVPSNQSSATNLSDRVEIAGRVADAKVAIAKEQQVVDFVLDPRNAVTLQVAVKDDGSRRHGYAQYLCMLLSDYGFDMSVTAVRVVDAAKVAASNGDFRSISLGTVSCRDGSRLD